MKTIPVSLILAGVLVPAMASAQPQDGPHSRTSGADGRDHGPRRHFMEVWQAADTNHDGYISKDEFDAMPRIQHLPEEKRDKLFKRFDKNGDGKLSREEIMSILRNHDGHGPPMQRFWELDTDHNGSVSFDEFKAGRLFGKLSPERQKALFQRLDTNGDGVISPLDKPKPPFRHSGGKPGDRHMDFRQMLRQLDKNGDGALSFEEFRASPWIRNLNEDEQEKRFQAFDRNHDLKLTAEDFPANIPHGERPERPAPAQ